MQQARLLRHVGEGAVAIIFEQAILAEVSAENIVEAIIVVVTDADSVRPPDSCEPCLLGDVRERAVAIVFVQTICCLGWRAFEPRSGKQEDVHPSIVVVVNKGATATIRLDDVLLLVYPAVDDGSMQTGFFCHVSELRVEGTAGGSRLCLRLHSPGCDSPFLLGEQALRGST